MSIQLRQAEETYHQLKLSEPQKNRIIVESRALCSLKTRQGAFSLFVIPFSHAKTAIP